MKTFLSTIAFPALIFFSGVQAFAQDQATYQDTIYLQVQPYGDSVVLRWAPGSSFLWKTANKTGYRIERKKSGEAGFESLIPDPVRPYTLREWKTNADTANVHVATAAQMALGGFFMEPSEAVSFSQKLTAAEEQQNRFALALFSAEFSTQAADGLAFRYVDSHIEPGVKYYYRVSLFDASGDYPVLPGTAYCETDDRYTPQQVQEVSAIGKDGNIEISWDRRTNNARFSGFFIERSDDGGKSFLRLNTVPIKSVRSGVYEDRYTYADEVERYYKPYHYRVIGITSFADMGAYSDVVKAQSVDLTAPAPPSMLKAVSLGENKVGLSWKDHLAPPPDHTGYYIGRSETVYGPFERVNARPLKISERTFIDEDPVLHKPNFYVVIVEDTAGNANQSVAAMAALKDYTPPAKPAGLTGVVDTLGIVSLAWELGNDEDLMGYRVYRSNHPDTEFIQITSEPIPGNFYRDTIPLKTLTEKIYYKIAAFDFNYNPSDYSAPLELNRPDYAPPVKPLIQSVATRPDTIELIFRASSSADVARHVIYRKDQSGDWRIIADLTGETTVFIDPELEEGRQFTYAIEAFDEAGNGSGKSFPVRATARASAKPAVNHLSGAFDKETKTFRLSWSYEYPGDYRFVIYRKDATGEEFRSVGVADKNTFEFTDHEFYRNEAGYEYAVRVVFANGSESPLSNALLASFE